MGCDIHLYAEKRVDGVWESADKWTPSEYEEGEFEVDYDDCFYSGRNYDLFAMLANVRNGRSAGIKTGDGFTPISMPKGLPADISPKVKAKADRWGTDGHSHSYLTLRELLEYDWDNQYTTKFGIVDCFGYLLWRKTVPRKAPYAYSGGVFGLNIRILTHDEMDRFLIESNLSTDFIEVLESLEPEDVDFGYNHLLSSPVNSSKAKHFQELMKTLVTRVPDIRNVYTQVDWIETYRQAAGEYFFNDTLPKLQSLGEPDDVRIVFFFDN